MITKKDTTIRFTLLMSTLTAGMVIMIIQQIHASWIWGLYITLWIVLSVHFSKQLKLGWHHWFFIISAIVSIDALALYLLYTQS